LGEKGKNRNIFRLFELNAPSMFGLLKPQTEEKDGKPAQNP